MDSPIRKSSRQGFVDGTPRVLRRSNLLSSSADFTPGKDFSSRTSSFKRLGSSVSRSLKPDQFFNALSSSRGSRLESSEFKVYIDVPLENCSANIPLSPTLPKGASPGTPKRSRADMVGGVSLDDSFDDISPIGSPINGGHAVSMSPRTTPKRSRRSMIPRNHPVGRSLVDLFSAVREEKLNEDHLFMSVDFTKLGASLNGTSATSLASPKTPVFRMKNSADTLSPPRAPKKLTRSSVDGVSSVLSPKRLDFGNSNLPTEVGVTAIPESTPSFPCYGSIMSIVGFVSSFITRTGQWDVSMDCLVEMIRSYSMNFKSRESAECVLRSLALVSPNWVKLDSDDMFHFETSVKSFDVLKQLRVMRKAQMNDGLQCAAMEE